MNNPLLNPDKSFDSNKKIALRPNEIVMRFVSARLVNNEYLCFYNITITPNASRTNPNFILLAKNIDQLSYKKAIEESIPAQDRKFMKLKTIDSFGAVLKFDVATWIDLAFKGVTPKIEQAGMKKSYKAKILPPRVMAYDVFMKSWQDYICKEFAKWIIKYGKNDTTLERVLPDNLKSKIKNNIMEVFDFNYDTNMNYMVVSMKTIWVMGVMLVMTKIAKLSESEKLDKKENDWYNEVDKELDSF